MKAYFGSMDVNLCFQDREYLEFIFGFENIVAQTR